MVQRITVNFIITASETQIKNTNPIIPRQIYSTDTMKSAHREQNSSPLTLHQRSHYHQIIQQLTQENQMLKRQLQTLNELKNNTPDIHRAETKEDENSPNDIRKTQSNENFIEQQQINSSERMMKSPKQIIPSVKQNQLKKLNYRVLEYQAKIQELTYFLKNVKQQQCMTKKQLTRDVSESVSFAKIVEVMEEVIKMFESDREVLLSKIQELLPLIAEYDRKEREYMQRQRQFQLDLSIAQEQLVIFKRLKKTK